MPFIPEPPQLITAKDVEKVVQDGNAKASDICTGAVQAACTQYGVK